jgi:hypothetical protein
VSASKTYSKLCSVPNCMREHEAKTYCKNHYKMWRKHGDTLIKGISSGRFKKGQKPANYSGFDTCTIEGCTNSHRSKGLCNTHFLRMVRLGDPLGRLNRMRGSAKERLKNMTDIDKDTGCIVWRGAVDTRGYGRLADDMGWYDMAHRLAYKIYVGEIPKGLVIHHKCHNTRCVNPDHLEPKTHYQNIIEEGKSNASYINSIKTHCIRGHELTPGNYYFAKNKYNGTRVCKTCHKARIKRYLLKKEGAI